MDKPKELAIANGLSEIKGPRRGNRIHKLKKKAQELRDMQHIKEQK